MNSPLTVQIALVGAVLALLGWFEARVSTIETSGTAHSNEAIAAIRSDVRAEGEQRLAGQELAARDDKNQGRRIDEVNEHLTKLREWNADMERRGMLMDERLSRTEGIVTANTGRLDRLESLLLAHIARSPAEPPQRSTGR